MNRRLLTYLLTLLRPTSVSFDACKKSSLLFNVYVNRMCFRMLFNVLSFNHWLLI